MTDETTPPPPRDRQREEPVGRWEGRCLTMTWLGGDAVLICDRPADHKGLHRGRTVTAGYGSITVIAYGAVR